MKSTIEKEHYRNYRKLALLEMEMEVVGNRIAERNRPPPELPALPSKREAKDAAEQQHREQLALHHQQLSQQQIQEQMTAPQQVQQHPQQAQLHQQQQEQAQQQPQQAQQAQPQQEAEVLINPATVPASPTPQQIAMMQKNGMQIGVAPQQLPYVGFPPTQ
jgi:hypothetical protein